MLGSCVLCDVRVCTCVCEYVRVCARVHIHMDFISSLIRDTKVDVLMFMW